MSPTPFILKPVDRGAALNVIGTKVTVLASEAGAPNLQTTLQSGLGGTGPPPHSHDWDESFYVTEGQIQFTWGNETTMCTTGTLVHVPACTVHAFSYGPGGGEMLEITGRGSKAVRLFTALDREIPPGPPDIAKAIQLLSEYGVKVYIWCGSMKGGENEKWFFEAETKSLREVFQKTGHDSPGWNHDQLFQEDGRRNGHAVSSADQSLPSGLCGDRPAVVDKLGAGSMSLRGWQIAEVDMSLSCDGFALGASSRHAV